MTYCNWFGSVFLLPRFVCERLRRWRITGRGPVLWDLVSFLTHLKCTSLLIINNNNNLKLVNVQLTCKLVQQITMSHRSSNWIRVELGMHCNCGENKCYANNVVTTVSENTWKNGFIKRDSTPQPRPISVQAEGNPPTPGLQSHYHRDLFSNVIFLPQ